MQDVREEKRKVKEGIRQLWFVAEELRDIPLVSIGD